MTTTTIPTPSHETVARRAKAARLASALLLAGVSPADAALLDTDGRAELAEIAGVRAPSDDTWAMTLGIALLAETANMVLR